MQRDWRFKTLNADSIQSEQKSLQNELRNIQTQISMIGIQLNVAQQELRACQDQVMKLQSLKLEKQQKMRRIHQCIQDLEVAKNSTWDEPLTDWHEKSPSETKK
jgi:chromosome segregation ATPase